jgi:pimeloyl-ACP methyl ester carboxylesterase/DNA-binding winged helix-turn-helix (wHTH) protein
MNDNFAKIYRFGEFELDVSERLLYAGDRPVQLAPKVFDTLLILVENAGRVLSKEKMLAEIWDDSFVEENNLAQNISILRKILGRSSESRFIETVPKFGYRFVAAVQREEVADDRMELFEHTEARVYIDGGGLQSPLHISGSGLALRGAPSPVTHYVRNSDVNIAYQVLGEGEIDIVFVMGWVSHLEYFWKHHLFASFLEKLASFSRLILFDKRGTGLSDPVPLSELPTLEQRMEDVRAVMDAVGSERAVLVGVSEGGPMCSLFAATYPEMTTALVMIGTYAKRVRDDDYPWAPTESERDAFFEEMTVEWGGPVGIEERAPTMAHDPEFRQWWAEYLRMGASPGAAVGLTRMNAEIDVRNVLPVVRVPTLVIHRSGDRCLKVEEGRYVASKIPNAKYVELGGIDHLPFVGDQDEILNEIQRFVTGIRHTDDYDRVLATVMNVKLADADGFRSRRMLFAQTPEFIRLKLEVYRGREVYFGNGEFLATFDGPARAIRCATAIVEAAANLGVPVKTGLHTGECDVSGNEYSGFAVDLARMIADAAEPGNIVVSRTVKDLVAGSGLSFTEYGNRSFENIEGDWRLFAVDH